MYRTWMNSSRDIPTAALASLDREEKQFLRNKPNSGRESTPTRTRKSFTANDYDRKDTAIPIGFEQLPLGNPAPIGFGRSFS